MSGLRHGLEDHLRGSAALARRFGDVFGAGRLAEYLALIHDVGKGACVWQEGLLRAEERGGGRVGVDHKCAGTWLAAQYLPLPFGGVVYGHHGGLPDMEQLGEAVKRGSRDAGVAEAVRRVEGVVPQIHPSAPPPVPQWLSQCPVPEGRIRLDLLMRMVFSCVVDADFLDTQAHFSGLGEARVGPAADMGALVARYERRRERKLAERRPSPVDAVRQEVYEQACAAAAGKPGMYVLHVPTGGAKTMAAGGFGLRHAAAHGMGRVVVAVPYISITQQNAQVYRDLLEPGRADEEFPVVLEHHSSVDLEPGEDRPPGSPQRSEDAARERGARLAAENWDAPFIITTTVQLFESLFSRKPSAMRKLHRLAGSVIVLDEVQALPDRLLVPILSGLRGLVEHFGASVLLVSATQPSFWSLERLEGLERRSVIDRPQDLFNELRRVDYQWLVGPQVTLQSVAQEAARHPQALTVVNTTADAAAFHRLLEVGGDAVPVRHLSTRMTADHRRQVIEEIRQALEQGRPIRVVSTQLIEAGVDLDFPRVYRAWAPAESIQQAAGRCNRDGRLPAPGTVVVFDAVDGHQPKGFSYRAALDATGLYFGSGQDMADPDDLAALERYYPHRYRLQQAAPGSGLGAEIEALRRKLDFPQVAAEFQMIEDGHSRPVVVIRDEADRKEIEDAVAQLHSPYPCGPQVLRGLQRHTASLPRREADAALKAGLADLIVGDLLLWRGSYHELRGLDPFELEDLAQFNL